MSKSTANARQQLHRICAEQLQLSAHMRHVGQRQDTAKATKLIPLTHGFMLSYAVRTLSVPWLPSRRAAKQPSAASRLPHLSCTSPHRHIARSRPRNHGSCC
jgi:hypothetical protein